MNNIYLSQNANEKLINYLTSLGHRIEFISSDGVVDGPIASHPDIFLCKMGVNENAPIFIAKREDLGFDYPNDIAFNAACTGKFFIHNLSYTNEKLLLAAKSMGMVLIDVKQGYTKCSTVIVDENSIITYDDGIVAACEKHKDLSVLKISPGFIKLNGYDTGFIGGTSGRIGKEILFNGDLSSHPDFSRIVDFIERRGLKCRWFGGYMLTDIGSIL